MAPLPENPKSLRRLLIASAFVNLLMVAAFAGAIWRMGGWENARRAMGWGRERGMAEYQKERAARFWDYPRSSSDVVFLGDSLTADAPFVEFFGHVKNRGIGGDTTTGVLSRLDEIVREKPATVFLMIGTNDVQQGTPVAGVVENYRKIIDGIRAASPATKIYVESVLPVNPAMLEKNPNPQIAALNVELQSLAGQKGCTWIDVRPAMSDPAGNLRAEYSKDGLHLTIEGKKALCLAIAPYVSASAPTTRPN